MINSICRYGNYVHAGRIVCKMKQSGRNPILAARCAALGYIREKLYPHAMLSDLKISIKRLTGNCGDKGMDLSYPLTHRMGENAAAVPKDGTELSVNTGDDTNPVFDRIYINNGYVVFHIGDDFLLSEAEKISESYPLGEPAEIIRVPESMEYAHARLLMYARSDCGKGLSPRMHAAAVLLLASLDGEEKEKMRILRAGVREVISAMDEAGCDPAAARAFAAILNMNIIR